MGKGGVRSPIIQLGQMVNIIDVEAVKCPYPDADGDSVRFAIEHGVWGGFDKLQT